MLNEFVKKIRKTENSFLLSVGRDTCMFAQVKLGNARHVYGVQVAYGTKEPVEILAAGAEHKLKLIAIVTDDTVCIVDPFIFNLRIFDKGYQLPDGVRYFNEVKNEINASVGGDFFQAFIDGLPTVEENIPEYILENLQKGAREEILYGKPSEHRAGNPPKYKPVFNDNDIGAILSGLIDPKEEALRRWSVRAEDFSNAKTCNTIRTKMWFEPDIVTPCELEISKALHTVDAQTVNVEFTIGEKTATGKMHPDTIIRCMLESGNISSYNFVTNKGGERVLMELGAAGAHWEAKRNDIPLLTVECISKITYGKKVLYTKECEVANT